MQKYFTIILPIAHLLTCDVVYCMRRIPSLLPFSPPLMPEASFLPDDTVYCAKPALIPEPEGRGPLKA